MESNMVRFALAAMRTIDGREAGLEAGRRLFIRQELMEYLESFFWLLAKQCQLMFIVIGSIYLIPEDSTPASAL